MSTWNRRVSAAAGKAWLGAALLALSFTATARDKGAEWREIGQLRPVIGADGLPHTASCSGYPGTDPTFRFWSRAGKSKNLVVFFEGGGACWDNLSCTFPLDSRVPPGLPQFFVPAVTDASAPTNKSGLFDDTRADNPVKDWTVVYIPYCTGDIHLGSSTRTYYNAGNPVFPLPPQFDIQHRGFDNFMVVLDWIKRELPKPERVLVTGSSAGGYGATGNFPWVAEAYPKAELTVMADASQGVTTPLFDKGSPGRQTWNPQLAPWVFGDGNVSGPELLRYGARAYPNGRFGQFSNVVDGVQIQFYGYMKQYYGPGGSCPNPVSDWNQQMLGTLASYSGELGNFRSYLAPGSTHTILRSPGFFSDVGGGQPVAAWLGALLNRGATGPGNAACADCLTPLPCL